MEYEDELIYKLWLSLLCGHNPKIVNKCVTRLGSAEEIYNSDGKYKELRSLFSLSRRLQMSRSLSAARSLAEYCADSGISIIPIDSKRYPKKLAEVSYPPQILYVKGDMPDIDNLVCVTIVGSRDCSDYGRAFANELAYDLTSSGILVVSGMAIGADSAAHIGALDAGGVTAAVLAGGVDVIYPKANAEIYSRIIENGAVISERPPGMVGRGEFYRERNRILVGLSNGVVIIEGSEKSGTKLTANWAAMSNRDIFAVPGKPGDAGAELPNKLIKDSAKLVTSAEDIIEEYISVYPVELKNGIDLTDTEKRKKHSARRNNGYAANAEKHGKDGRQKSKPDFGKFDDKQRIILEYLYNNNDAVHIDDIARECGIDTTELSFLIIQLLMERAVEEHPGEYYSIL